MTKRFIYAGVAVTVVLGVWLLRPSRPEAEALPSQSHVRSGEDVGGAITTGQGKTIAPVKYQNNFAKLSKAEAEAILVEIVKKDSSSILDELLVANRVEHDLSKMSAIATKLTGSLRSRGIPAALAAKLRALIEDSAGDPMERQFLLGAVGSVWTQESIELLLAVLPALANQDLYKMALNSIGESGSMRGDGNYHEERVVPLKKIWHESDDPLILDAVARSMAAVGEKEAVGLLLKSAAAQGVFASDRKRIATEALGKVYTPNAVPAVAAFLKPYTALNAESRLGSNILIRIGDATASTALLLWLQSTDDSAAPIVTELGRRTRTEEMEVAWELALEQSSLFRSRKVYDAIANSINQQSISKRLEPLVKQ